MMGQFDNVLHNHITKLSNHQIVLPGS